MPRPELSTLRYPNLWQGCVGAWCPSQSGATGYRLFDDSGNNNHGTLTNMDPGTDWVPSGGKLALDFDGVNDYAITPALGPATFNRSVALWFKTSLTLSGTTYSSLISWGAGTTSQAFIIAFGNGGAWGGNSLGISQWGDQLVVTGYNDGKWHGISVVNEGTLWSMFIDGAFVTSKNMTTTPTQKQVYFGTFDSILGSYFSGQIDDIRIYNRALAPYEIRQLASSRGAAYERSRGRKKAYVPGYRITAPSRIQTGSARTIDGTDTESLRRGLIGAWCPSLGASGYRLLDRSGNNNHGTLTNMDPGTDWVPSGGKLALDFDGVNDRVPIVASSKVIPTGPFSVSLWAISKSVKTHSPLGTNEGINTDVTSIDFFDVSGVYWARSRIGGTDRTASGGSWPLNTWITMVARYTGSAFELYANGLLIQSIACTGNVVQSAGTLAIGSRGDFFTGQDYYYNGQIDDIRIYNRALTPSEIRLLYTGGRGVGLLPEAKPKRARIVAWDNRDKISVPARVLTNTDSLKRGLVGHWSPSLSGPQGNRLMDLSGQNNHGTLTNMDYQTDYVPSTDKGGRMALDFDGSNDYVDIPDSPSLNPTKQITICCWYYSRGLPSSTTPFTYCLLGKTTSVVAEPYPAFDIRGSSTSTLELAIAIGTPFKTVSLGTITQNTWTFIAATYNGAVLAGYRNGVLVQSSSQSGDIGTTTNPLRLGDNFGFSPRFFNGQLDDIRIYNRALTPNEIRLLAQSRQPELATPQRTRTVFYSSGLVSYLRRRTYNSILGSGVLS